MIFKLQTLATLLLTFYCHELFAETPTNADNALGNLYENMLQREYAGPVVFPNHQVERKAVRSPSLRLRFGRRSDPDLMIPSTLMDKRGWFGDVNQKPIRSPSLRLRFGRRSDPNMPLHSNFDNLMENLALNENTAVDDDYGDVYDTYQRIVRKPQRLRFGRSVPVFEGENNDVADAENEHDKQLEHADELLNNLVSSEKLRNMLRTLRRLDAEIAEAAAAAATNVNGNADFNVDGVDDEFEREVRKPSPLRLRFGRSTNNAQKSTIENGSNIDGIKKIQQKKSIGTGVDAKKTQGKN